MKRTQHLVIALILTLITSAASWNPEPGQHSEPGQR